MGKDNRSNVSTPAKNAGQNAGVDSPDVQALFAGGERVDLGFAPYWNPSEGAKLAFIPLAYDAGGDGPSAFPRVICKALHSLQCQRGPKLNAQKVTVEKDQAFTMSPYPGLHLESLYGVPVLVTFGKLELMATKTAEGKPKHMWSVAEVVVPPGQKASVERVHAERMAAAAQLRAANKPAAIGSGTNGAQARV